MNYPNGQQKGNYTSRSQAGLGHGNRGMTLEEDINATNQFYLDTDKAIIHKKPTPVQIVKVNYPRRSAAKITEAYFKQASTTDYNGIYRNRYIDFEVKNTKNKTLFPLANIHEHQIEHMESVVRHGGISFIIIRFSLFDETYLLKTEDLLTYWYNMKKNGRKSIPYEKIKLEGFIIPFKYQARVDYLSVIDQLHF